MAVRADGVRRFVPGQGGQVGPALALGTGAWYSSTWDFDGGYHWYERWQRIGTYWDRMVALQALVAGVLGLGLGLGAVSAFGLNASGGKLAFKMLWQIPLIAAGAVLIICILASVVSMWKVVRLDPADVFKGA